MSATRQPAPKRLRRAARRLVDDVDLFGRHALRRPLRPYQLEVAWAVLASVVRAEGESFTVLFPRQAGKNELSAHLEAFLLYRYQRVGGSLVKAAPTFKPQVVNSILRLERLLQGPLTRGRWRRRQGYIFQLGEATCTFFSAQPGADIVGATATLLLEGDEAQDLDPEKWDKDLVPMAATGNATRVLYGTPWTDDTLLAREIQWNHEREARDGRRRHFETSWEQVAAANPAYGRHVEAEIARLGPSHPIIRTQYLLQPLGRGGRFLDAAQLALLQGAHSPLTGPASLPGLPGGVWVAGLDVAGADEEDPDGLLRRVNPARDSTVLTIALAEPARVAELVVEPKLYVVRQYAWRGTPHRQLYPLVLALVRDTWRCRAVVVDATGIGSGLAAFLGAALGPRIVRPYLYTAASKSKLAYDFLAAVNSGRLKVYADPVPSSQFSVLRETRDRELRTGTWDLDQADLRRELLAQCAAAEHAVRANQTMIFFVPEARGHDDLLNALVLLVQAGPVAGHRVASGRRAAGDPGRS